MKVYSYQWKSIHSLILFLQIHFENDGFQRKMLSKPCTRTILYFFIEGNSPGDLYLTNFEETIDSHGTVELEIQILHSLICKIIIS